MAKPKSPLLSFGARGSIADTLTFQKRGRLTIARQKPIPTDPKTDLQLAQRQVYGDAVAAWNLLTTEEKEAYRGVCPGLTPYQCYMKTALKYVEPVPPPEEYTEEQEEHDGDFFLGSNYLRVAQKLTIPPGRQITKLGLWLWRSATPSGILYFRIRRVSDNGVELEKLWGDPADLPAEANYEELTFDTPKTLTGNHYIGLECEGATETHACYIRYKGTNVKPDEALNYYETGAWSEVSVWDLAYRYKYYEV